MSNELHDVIMQIPPVTRAMVLSSVVLFLGSSLGFIKINLLPNYWSETIFKLQIWRPVTAFLMPFGFPMACAMDIYALYKYGRQLEEDKFNRATADYLFFMIIITTVITICSTILGGTTYLKPLIVALVYTWSQDHADTVVSFYFLRIKASYVPVLLLLVDLIISGQLSMLISGTGYVAGHLYLFLDVLYPKAFGVSRLISTPQFLTRLFPSRASSTKANGAFTAYRPVAKTGNTTASSSGKSSNVGSSSASSTGSSTGFGRFSLSSGPFQGKGRRLGE